MLHRSWNTFFTSVVFCLVLGLEDDTAAQTDGRAFLINSASDAGMMRLQGRFSPDMNFPCSKSQSWERPWEKPGALPTSVHALRPRDVSVVGALGDSLVAGNGAMEQWALGTIFQARGVSWCAGGDSTWREVLTLPNILREYNPRLTGFSTGKVAYGDSNAGFNIAFPVASAMDILNQAKVLVNRMKRDPKVNFKEDWKVITILFGANDACSLECFDNGLASPSAFVRNIMLGLDYLQENLPRAFVNLVPNIDVTVSLRVKRTPMCQFLHVLFCQCLHRGNYDRVGHLANVTVEYQRGMEDLVNSGRYEKREDFTVVVQPFLKILNLQNVPGGRQIEAMEETYITHDCFHFSQKGHALAANMLWNNMLEPLGSKSEVKLDYVLQKFRCPSERAPYFFTAKNTKKYYATGYQ